MTVRRELERLLGTEGVAVPAAQYLVDETKTRGLKGHADALALPRTAEEVARVLRWCYAHDVPVTPRGGGTGLAGGAVPAGGVVLSLERLRQVREFEPLLWRLHVEAGLRTAEIQRLARENGLWFPPDPGAGEQSQIGGNLATNAGGPHAFKYGVTGAWVTGVEAVIAPGEIVSLGGPLRKDVAEYDLVSLLIGSEGTLGVITAAWLRLLPRPEAEFPVIAFYRDVSAGCEALETLLGHGAQLAAVDFLDGAALQIAGSSFPQGVPDEAGFALLGEADGTAAGAAEQLKLAREALGGHALVLRCPEAREAKALWAWRDTVSPRVAAHRGGKLSEDIAVPVERLGAAIAGAHEVARRHGVEACTWGHAGDGNLHCAFLFDPDDPNQSVRAGEAAVALFDLAHGLGGSPSGEHGIGTTKRAAAAKLASPQALRLGQELKKALDPKGLLNPGKKI